MILFVGERRSKKAIRMNVRWEDGRLAAKQLFSALNALAIDRASCRFTNLFERGGKATVRYHQNNGDMIVGMGCKVHKELTRMRIPYRALIHPAARGSIRLKARYTQHVADVLRGGY